MAGTIIEVPVRELRAGDKVLDKGRLVYEVVEILRDEPQERLARVQWLDGGYDIRAWDPEHFDQLVQIARPVVVSDDRPGAPEVGD